MAVESGVNLSDSFVGRTVFRYVGKSLEIGDKGWFAFDAIPDGLQAVFLVRGKTIIHQVVDTPVLETRTFDEAALPEQLEVFGHLDLRSIENFLEVANAKRTRQQEIKDA